MYWALVDVLLAGLATGHCRRRFRVSPANFASRILLARVDDVTILGILSILAMPHLRILLARVDDEGGAERDDDVAKEA
jgi:hypothetical protein